MDVFDIIGPVMVGPSSSHTAGAVRIGYIAGKLLGEKAKAVSIGLCGSFLATGKGHGTDKALVAGLLGMKTDDERIPQSLEIARCNGMTVHFFKAEKKDAHPNTAILQMTGQTGRKLEVVACSLGGGRIKICEIDGLTANFCGDYPTLIVHNEDKPGHLSAVTAMLAEYNINVATMQLYRGSRGASAVMIIECDEEIPLEPIKKIEQMKGILKVTYLSLSE